MAVSKKSTEELHIELLNEIYAFKTDDNQEFLDFALDQVIKLTESKYGFIYFYDEKTQLFQLNTWSKDVMPDCAVAEPQTCYELNKTGFWGEAVRQRKAIINNNFEMPHHHKKGTPDGHVSINKFFTTPVF